MGYLWIWVTCGALLASCSSPSPTHGDACRDRSGIYLASYTLSSGTCGAIPDNLTQAREDQEPEPGCEILATVHSDDNCRIYTQQVCRGAGDVAADGGAMPGPVLSQDEEVLRWDVGAMTGEGTLEIKRYDEHAVELCRATYDVTYTAQ
jgi:hypothetical protein